MQLSLEYIVQTNSTLNLLYSAGISVLLMLHVNLGVLQHIEQARSTGLCEC